MCNYGFDQNIFSYVHGTTSDGTLHTTARGGQSCSQNVQANSCDYSVHVSERFWNGKRSHCPVGPFWNGSEGNGPVHTVLSNRSERWERSRRCSVNGVLAWKLI